MNQSLQIGWLLLMDIHPMIHEATYTERVANLFRRWPNIWISAIEIENVGGRQGWRTRVSECRRQRGMTIENRQRWVPRHLDRGGLEVAGYRLSEYRWVPNCQEPVTKGNTMTQPDSALQTPGDRVQ